MSDNMLAHVIADFNDVRRRLVQELERCRDWNDDMGETCYLTGEDIEKLVARMTSGIAALCHVLDPQRHTSLVREECTYEEETAGP
jgi:hypothetical protein